MNNLIIETQIAKDKINNVLSDQRNMIEKLEEEAAAISSELQEKIYELQEKKRETERHYNKMANDLKEENKAILQPFNGTIDQYKRVIKLLGVKNDRSENNLSLTANLRDEKEIICIDEPLNNKYIHIYVLVYENDKPKNKYSLAIAGVSIFPQELLGYGWNYTQIRFSGNNPTFEFKVKDAPTKEELIDFYNKKGISNLWKQKEYETLVTQYEKVLSECSNQQWEKEYLLYQKDYYENHYSRGIEQPEYKEIIKKLRKFNTLQTA